MKKIFICLFGILAICQLAYSKDTAMKFPTGTALPVATPSDISNVTAFQTPWASNINGSTYNLTNVGNITTNTFQLTVPVTNYILSHAVETYELGIGKTLTMESGSSYIFYLPTLSSSEVGKPIMFVKKGSGQLTIYASGSQIISDSSAGGTIYDDQVNETYATITLTPISTTQWVVSSGEGTWITS